MYRELVLEDEEGTFELKRQLQAAIGELKVHFALALASRPLLA